MRLRRALYIAVAALLLLNGVYSYRAYCAPGKAGGGGGQAASVEEKLEILMQVMEMIRRNHIDGDKITDEQLLTDAIRGMTASLDPFSEYMPPKEYHDFSEDSSGAFGGIGIVLDYRPDGAVIVKHPIEDTPAARAGIQAGDQIVEIDGEALEPGPRQDVSLKLRGESGTQVEVGIRRGGAEEVIRYTLTRAEIAVSSVEDVHVIEGTRVGYVRVTEFTQTAPKDFEAALRRLEPQATEGLVIDLRFNPGGLLESARLMCSNFLPKDRLVVSVVGRHANETYESLSGGGYKFPAQVPVVILINGGSASAAEIMSSCLNDYDRAGLVGEKSYGKGSVQNVVSFPDGSGLKLTVNKYFTKSHREIHGVGIMPEMVKRLTRREYLRLDRIEDVAERDRQDSHLALALEYIRDYKGRPSLYRQTHPEEKKAVGDKKPDGEAVDGEDGAEEDEDGVEEDEEEDAEEAEEE